MSETKAEQSDALTKIAIALGGLVFFIGFFIAKGIFNKKTWTNNFMTFWGTYILLDVALVYSPRWNIPVIIHHLSPSIFPKGLATWVYFHIPKLAQVGILLSPLFIYLLILGAIEFAKVMGIQNKIRHLGLKTSTGLEPKVKNIIKLDDNKSKIIVQAIGLDVAEFSSKKGSLESSLNKIVQDIRVSPQSKQIFEIIVSTKELPTMIRFDDVSEKLSQPYSFLVGEANNGFICGDLRELHHVLIAGSTGGGKSVFFKQALVSLLKSSEHVQLYLIDLKRGVEMRMFEQLSNVYVAKDVVSALNSLRLIEREMNRRFEILEKNGFTEINPKRDKLDRLVIGIDEASVLFTVEKGTSSNKQLVLEARELTDKLTKLGRAAGIHVILATQKVTKETIDTRVQTNIHARICFRVNTVASSMTVLGNKKASELPEIRGRGIWSVGSKDIEVQVPNLEHEEAKDEIELLVSKFNVEPSLNFQEMLSINNTAQESAESFKDTTEINNKSAA